jgi:hypothetical protein
LSRREVRQLLQELCDIRLSLGAVARQEQAQSAALAPVVEEAQAAVQQAAVVNMDETGWREEQRRALCHAHLKRDFQGLVDRGGEAAPIGRWGLAEIERLLTVIASCRQHGRSLLAFWVAAGARLLWRSAAPPLAPSRLGS